MKDNLWILTEERPKNSTLSLILRRLAAFCGPMVGDKDTMRIIPLADGEGNFAFKYEVTGVQCSLVDKIYIKTVSGKSSLADFIIFRKNNEPETSDKPCCIIEETKTDDSESRNTGVFQRCSKFVYASILFHDVPKIMLYSLEVSQKNTQSQTNVFGSRLLATYGVDIEGRDLAAEMLRPFKDIDEVIRFKKSMQKPPRSNVQVTITRYDDRIEISGRLYKDGRLAHDPNIGQMSIIAAVLRKLGWTKRIVVTCHGLSQDSIGRDNKFVHIANCLSIELDGLQVPRAQMHTEYWHYECNGEKLGTIFIHLAVEAFTNGRSIFENHAGCEKGYFHKADGSPEPLAKYDNKELYKAGDKSQIIYIPDLVLCDPERREIIIVEGKKWKKKADGVRDLDNYDSFEEKYVKIHYPEYKVLRTVVLFGSRAVSCSDDKVGFLLNAFGKPILGPEAPELFRRAVDKFLGK